MALLDVGPVDALFISPHFDDVVFSCGGMVAQEARNGRVLVVTVFAGEPSGPLNPFAEFQHRRWGCLDDAVDERRVEDAAALAALGADHRWLDFPDAIYRGSLYLSDDDLFGEVKAEDRPLAARVAEAIEAVVATAAPGQIYLPMGVGNHVDHQILHSLGPRILAGRSPVFYYEDFPYAATPGALETRLDRIGRTLTPVTVDIADTIELRLRAMRCHASQLPTVFRNYGDAEDVVRRYAASVGSGECAERFWFPKR